MVGRKPGESDAVKASSPEPGQQFNAVKGSGEVGTSNCPLVQQQGPLLKHFDQQRGCRSQFGVGEDMTGRQFMKTSIDSFQELLEVNKRKGS